MPESIFAKRSMNSSSEGAAVIVYIFGGGYTGGSKTSSGNPAGLIHNSLEGGSEGVIYVGINYRVSSLKSQRSYQKSPSLSYTHIESNCTVGPMN